MIFPSVDCGHGLPLKAGRQTGTSLQDPSCQECVCVYAYSPTHAILHSTSLNYKDKQRFAIQLEPLEMNHVINTHNAHTIQHIIMLAHLRALLSSPPRWRDSMQLCWRTSSTSPSNQCQRWNSKPQELHGGLKLSRSYKQNELNISCLV